MIKINGIHEPAFLHGLTKDGPRPIHETQGPKAVIFNYWICREKYTRAYYYNIIMLALSCGNKVQSRLNIDRR